MTAMVAHSCRGCRALITRGAFCSSCAPAAERRRHNKAYDTPEYRTARARALAEHRRLHGDWCLGDDQHAAHPSNDLTCDHPVALARGGDLSQRLVVMCRSANSRKGAR